MWTASCTLKGKWAWGISKGVHIHKCSDTMHRQFIKCNILQNLCNVWLNTFTLSDGARTFSLKGKCPDSLKLIVHLSWWLKPSIRHSHIEGFVILCGHPSRLQFLKLSLHCQALWNFHVRRFGLSYTSKLLTCNNDGQIVLLLHRKSPWSKNGNLKMQI